MTDAEPIGTLQEQMVCNTSVSEPHGFVRDRRQPSAKNGRCQSGRDTDVLTSSTGNATPKLGTRPDNGILYPAAKLAIRKARERLRARLGHSP